MPCCECGARDDQSRWNHEGLAAHTKITKHEKLSSCASWMSRSDLRGVVLGRALAVHHFRRECLGLAKIDEVFIGRLVREQFGQIFQCVGGKGRGDTTEEGAEIYLAAPLRPI